MGVYPIVCEECGESFLWFSGNGSQVCAPCSGLVTMIASNSNVTFAAVATGVTMSKPKRVPDCIDEHIKTLIAMLRDLSTTAYDSGYKAGYSSGHAAGVADANRKTSDY